MISFYKSFLLIPGLLAQLAALNEGFTLPSPTANPGFDCSNKELPQYFVSSPSENLFPVNATAYCDSLNSTLVVVDDIVQDQCVFQKLIETDDFASEGHTRGLLGAFSQNRTSYYWWNGDKVGGYTNWDPNGSPSGSTANPGCAKAIVSGNDFKDYSWFSVSCNTPTPILCQKCSQGYYLNGCFDSCTNISPYEYWQVTCQGVPNDNWSCKFGLSIDQQICFNFPIDYGQTSTSGTIDFSNSKIKSVNRYSFGGAKMGNCLKIDLFNNLINDLNQGLFYQNVIVSTIDLSNNNISEVSDDIFSFTESLSDLDLSGNEFETFSPDLLLPTKGSINSIKLNNNKLQSTGNYSVLTGLSYLDLTSNQFNEIDASDFCYTSLNSLYIDNITKIRKSENCSSSGSFSPSGYLSASFANGQLTEIDEYAFKNTFSKYWTKLDLGYNSIMNITNVFSGIYDIESLYLNNNQIATLPSDIFSTISSSSRPQEFYINNNNLLNFDQSTLIDLSNNIQKINASNNLISEDGLFDLESYNYGVLKYLEVLDFSNNNLTGNFDISHMKPSSSDKNTNLVTLNFSHNQLDSMGSFSYFYYITELDFSYNNINSIDQFCPSSGHYCFYNSDNLKINLSHNEITNIHRAFYYVYPYYGSWDLLDLSFNQLQSVDSNTFYRFDSSVSPKVLKLNNNNLNSISSDAFRYMPKIYDLDLSNNYLSTLSSSVFSYCTYLTDLNLSNNGLVNLPSLSYTDNLKTLNLSKNQLVTFFSNFRYLDRLVDINLSDNKISTLSTSIFQDNYKLRKIDLSNNALYAVQDKTFSYSSYLEYVNLSGNKCTPYPAVCDGSEATYTVLKTCECN